jgi:ATP/maltotriose-dependent transcriptional regulator MalT
MLEDAIGRSAVFPDTNAANVIRVGLLHGRATLLAAREDVVAAVAQYEQALNALIEIVPRDDWRVGRTRYNLARVQMRTGDLKRAFENARESEKILHEKKGADATMTRESASLLAAIRAMAAQSGVAIEESASLDAGEASPALNADGG